MVSSFLVLNPPRFPPPPITSSNNIITSNNTQHPHQLCFQPPNITTNILLFPSYPLLDLIRSSHAHHSDYSFPHTYLPVSFHTLTISFSTPSCNTHTHTHTSYALTFTILLITSSITTTTTLRQPERFKQTAWTLQTLFPLFPPSHFHHLICTFLGVCVPFHGWLTL